MPKKTTDKANNAVREALYRLATGYTVTTQKHFKQRTIEYDPQTGKKIREKDEPILVTEEQYIPPSVTAACQWLDRNPEDPTGGLTPQTLFPHMAKALLDMALAQGLSTGNGGGDESENAGK